MVVLHFIKDAIRVAVGAIAFVFFCCRYSGYIDMSLVDFR